LVFLRFSYRRNGLFRKVVFFPFVFLTNQKLDTALTKLLVFLFLLLFFTPSQASTMTSQGIPEDIKQQLAKKEAEKEQKEKKIEELVDSVCPILLENDRYNFFFLFFSVLPSSFFSFSFHLYHQCRKLRSNFHRDHLGLPLPTRGLSLDRLDLAS